MKNLIFNITAFILIVLTISINLSKNNKNFTIESTLTQQALTCNIVPEVPEDYCWEIEYTSPTTWNCYKGGIWSCFV